MQKLYCALDNLQVGCSTVLHKHNKKQLHLGKHIFYTNKTVHADLHKQMTKEEKNMQHRTKCKTVAVKHANHRIYLTGSFSRRLLRADSVPFKSMLLRTVPFMSVFSE